MAKKKIVVINGSPKGDNSITLQTVHYISRRFPEHEFVILPVGARIRSYEKDMAEALKEINSADLLLFSYPVYTFLVPSQLHRFIELLKESGTDLSGTYATQISTSKHFYDVTAHRFIEDNCRDLGLKIIRGLSADMDDLTKKKGQQQAYDFFNYVLWSMGEETKIKKTVSDSAKDHRNVVASEVADKDAAGGDKPVVVVTDAEPEDAPLLHMIKTFCDILPKPSVVVNIREFGIRGGCLGCMRCSSTGKCVYTDGFSDLLREKIQGGCAIVYAFTVKDHSMGAYFKMYDDRQFCNGHRTVTMGSPIGYLVNGRISEEQNLTMVLEARAEAGGNFLAGIASNEQDADGAIRQLSDTLVYALETHYAPPSNFFGVGGMKIFRDLIYQMRGIMREDHRFFKAHGQYDFPQKKKGTILAMYLVGMLFSSEKLMAKMGNKMTEGMIAPYKKVLDKMEKEENGSPQN